VGEVAEVAEARLGRIDAALIAVWAGLSLLARRLLGTFPIAADPQRAVSAILELGPGKLIWIPLVCYAGLLPLAVLVFHRVYAGRARTMVRLASAAGGLGFLLYSVGLSLNVVEAASASAAVSGLALASGENALERFTSLWRADQFVSGGVVLLLAGWMAAISRAGMNSGFAAWPRWFGIGGMAAAAVTIAAGIWGIASQGALAAVDGGDALILVHLWIGLAGTLIWQQYGTRPRAA
jgi:uncharacterized membrane protein YhdT